MARCKKCGEDSLAISAGFSRKNAEIRELKERIEEIEARAELLRFCLDQARIPLEHFSRELPDICDPDCPRHGTEVLTPHD